MLSEAEARNAVITALDCGRDEALALADTLSGHAGWVKVGMTLYYACGPEIVSEMHRRGLKVFLDLKLHDIPHQIRGAAEAASRAGADILSVHALGGAEMVKAAREGVEAAAKDRDERTKIIAISVLTSMDQAALASIGVADSVANEVARLAKLAYGAGADGMVCSPQEAHELRELLGPDALVVTPGVRPAGSAVGDQKRIATPASAIASGASKLVVGRPNTQAEDPAAAFEAIVSELCA